MANVGDNIQQQTRNSRGAGLRRPPAHQSLSLRHDVPTAGTVVRPSLVSKQSQERHSTRANPPSTLSSRPAHQKDSSGESSNAERWFESNNNNNRLTSPSFLNDEPPYLLRNPSSSEESPNGLANPLDPAHLPYRTSVFPMNTGASSSEDFRDVIDDLTIQNKRLKRRLRKYEKTQDPHLQQEKLFEVRMHGLPADKRKELEEMLKKFVMDCRPTKPRHATSAQGQNSSRSAKKKSPSHASTRFGDSAYASMSGTNQASSAASNQHARNTSQHGFSASGLSTTASVQKTGVPTLSSQPSGLSSSNSVNPNVPMYPGRGMSHQQNQTIHSYLHDIPLGLLAKPGLVNMSEKAKKKLVVRRLESIFAGKAQTPQGHQQALQQQEVSHSAVRADREAMEESGQRMPAEGAREAQFMAKAKKTGQDHHEISGEGDTATKAGDAMDVTIEERDFAHAESSEQRPTRPLDLDPFRAQVPEDNIKYIRHLGFSPRDYATMSPPRAGHGWIYVNLLINMAQLHTLNVTPDFVRKAVAEMSSFIEVSEDGRKLRWKGGVELSRTSSDGSPDVEHGQANSGGRNLAVSRKDQRPRSKLSHSASHDGSSEMMKSVKAQSKDKLAYTPLFFHKSESEEDDDDEMSDDDASGWSSPNKNTAGDPSALASPEMRTQASRKKPADGGPIIFYNKANFCTDLSGDPRGKHLFAINNTNYTRVRTVPVGANGSELSNAWAAASEARGMLSHVHSATLEDVMEVDTMSQQDDFDLEIVDASDGSISDDDSSTASSNVELEASGIGGVMPTDHFTVRVTARQQATPSLPSRLTDTVSKLPPRLRKGLQEEILTRPMTSSSNAPVRIRQQVLSEQRRDLRPSELPPPSFYPLSSPEEDSDEDSDGQEEDGMSEIQIDQGKPLPSAAPQPINISSLSSSESEDGSASEDESSDDDIADDDRTDGIDLLAHARLVDPAAVIAREREYDCEMAERLAEEIPAGSSAATAGGGSGFNSPADAKDAEANQAAWASRGSSLAAVRSLKRARQSDGPSMAVSRSRKSPKLETVGSVSS